MRSRGFTVIEIMIAAAIFAGFMTGVMLVFRSGSSSFIIGSWKTNAQKKTQIFLSQFKDDLEKANHPYAIGSMTSTLVASTPLYFNSGAFDATGSSLKKLDVTGSSWILVAAMNVTRPRVLASIYDPGSSGKWTGVAVWAKSGKILYVRSNNPADFSTNPANIPGTLKYQPGGVVVGGAFEPSTERIFRETMVEDVESISIQQQRRNNEVVLEITVKVVRIENNKKTATSVVEQTRAKPANTASIEAF